MTSSFRMKIKGSRLVWIDVSGHEINLRGCMNAFPPLTRLLVECIYYQDPTSNIYTSAEGKGQIGRNNYLSDYECRQARFTSQYLSASLSVVIIESAALLSDENGWLSTLIEEFTCHRDRWELRCFKSPAIDSTNESHIRNKITARD